MRLDSWDGEAVSALAVKWEVARVEAWSEIGSTSDRAAALARGGCAPWTVVLADEQTQGRGRQGDRWQSASGAGLWMTVVVPTRPFDYPLPLVAGVACIEAIDSVAPSVRPLIKWPNDIYVGDRKLGGVLCETRGEQVFIGIGINTAEPEGGFDESLSTPPVTLEEAARKSQSRNQLAGAVLAALRTRLLASAGPEGVARLLAGRDYLADRAVQTEEHGIGVARGIDPTGALLLERPSGSRVRVVSGRVRVQNVSQRRA